MRNDADHLILLQLLLTKGVGVSRARSIVNLATQQDQSLAELLEDKATRSRCLTDPQNADFDARDTSAMDLARDLQDAGVDLLAIFDSDYPKSLKRLGARAPLLLFLVGNRELLHRPAVGFCGSRKATEKGIGVARDCAQQLASNRITVVSGNASGVDLAAHAGALEAGGTTVLVLPEGILRFQVKRALKDLWDERRVAVISEFMPRLPWKTHNAMQRNLTICGLSHAMILIEAGTTGGSIAAGRTCIECGIPLFAAEYDGMPEAAAGNRKLLAEGARRLMKSKATGRANLEEVLSEVERKCSTAQSELSMTDQSSLFPGGQH